MQQVVTFSYPRLVATSVSTLLAIIDHISHIPSAILLEDGWTVYLVIVVRRRNHQTIFVRRAHLVIDALHILMTDVLRYNS